jgi:hypothetical protein
MARDSHSGRIRPHERDTNNLVPILGASIEVLDRHSTCTGGSKNKYDLVYEEGMNVKMVKAFLVNKKQKTNGKTSSHVHLQKYNDTILNGAKKAGQRLPQSYYEELETFFNAYKNCGKERRAA